MYNSHSAARSLLFSPLSVATAVFVLPFLLTIPYALIDCNTSIIRNSPFRDLAEEMYTGVFYGVTFMPSYGLLILSKITKRQKYIIGAVYTAAALVLILTLVFGIYGFLVYGSIHDFLMMRQCAETY